MRIIVFFGIFYLLLLLGFIYIGRSFYKNVPALKKRPKLVFGVITFLFLFQAIGFTFYRGNQTETSIYLVRCIYLILGLFVCLIFYLSVGNLSLKIARLFKVKGTDIDRRTFFGMVGISAANVVFGVAEAVRGPKLYNVTIPIKNLPNSFIGYKIVQISDLHVGPTINRAYVERVRGMANSLNPDMVALTGDLLDGNPATIKSDLRPLADLQSKDGLFFVSGNHEYYWNYPAWQKIFLEWGFIILENSSHIITRGNDRLSIVGLPDQMAERRLGIPINLEKAMENVRPSDKKILLAHRPLVFDKNNDYNIDLQLSGHTHGGQFFPWNLIIMAVWKYYAGLNNHKGTWIYVNRGTGYWGPPLRSGVVAELTQLILQKA